MLQKIKANKLYYFICLSAICIFAVITYNFPYSGDDWAWGSSLGLLRLESWFDGYNGRYLGNLLVLLLTRSKFLDTLAMTLCYFISCWLCTKYTNTKQVTVLIFSIVLFFFMPHDIFSQSVVWTSGFANYVPSSLITLIYIVLVKNITDHKEPEYPKYLFVFTFLMGLCGALFMEINTLFNILLGIVVIIYTFVKWHKKYSAHISFLIGALIGALIMFSNSSYFNIVNGTDIYRETASGLQDVMELAVAHLYVVFKNLIIDNVFMCIIISIFISVSAKIYLKTSVDKRKKRIIISSLLTNYLSLFVIILENILTIAGVSPVVSEPGLVHCITSLFYITTVAIIVLFTVKEERHFSLIFPFCCVPVVIAPFLVVDPMGPRCLFIAYLFMMVFTVELFDIIKENFNKKDLAMKVITCIFSITLLAQAVYYISIFQPIHKYGTLRDEFIYTQVDNNESTIYLCKLPNEDYVHMGTPANIGWLRRYYHFLGIENDLEKRTEHRIIPYDEFEELVKNYNK